MEIFRSLEDVKIPGRCAVAVGYFDGLHLGHSIVIRRAVSYQSREGLRPCVFTFHLSEGAHPEFKEPDQELISEEQKYELMEKWGVETVVDPDFSSFSRLTPEQFVREVLVHRLGAAAVCCGSDYRFGRGASAGVAELITYCSSKGITVDEVSPVMWMGKKISSSWIRARLVAGDMDAATSLLGRPFSYILPVEHGQELGRKLDFPTLNQTLPENMTKLRNGVYASVAGIGGDLLPAVTNIGVRPTVAQGETVNSETYIIGFDGDLYGKKVEVRLLRFLREEKKFAGVGALKEQIRKDAEKARPTAEKYLKKNA